MAGDPTIRQLDFEEIDITQIFRKLILFIRKNLKTLVGFLLLGALGGEIVYLLTPRQYEVTMVAESRFVSGNEVAAIVRKWQSLIKNGNTKELANEWGIDHTIVNYLINIEAEVNELAKPTSARDNSARLVAEFVINAVITDNSVVDSLQWGIIHGFEANQHIQQRVTTEKQGLILLSSRLAQEISHLDTVKLVLQNMIKKGSNVGGNAFITEPGTVHEKIVDLYERLLDVKKELQFTSMIQIISGFNRPEHPAGSKQLIYPIVGAIVGICIALAVLFIRSLDLSVEKSV